MLTRSRLNSIESKVSEVLINNEISYDDFMKIINKGKKYRVLKEIIRTIIIQRSDVEKIILMEEHKKIGVNKVIKGNKIIDSSLKP